VCCILKHVEAFYLQTAESSGPKVLETAEEIQQRREEVLNRYHRFKKRVAERGQKLEESYHYQVFRREADDLEKWIMEKLEIAKDKSYEPTNIQVTELHRLPQSRPFREGNRFCFMLMMKGGCEKSLILFRHKTK
jgi:dTDP-4-amino-4,6-dideoxygalactose transaminase